MLGLDTAMPKTNKERVMTKSSYFGEIRPVIGTLDWECCEFCTAWDGERCDNSDIGDVLSSIHIEFEDIMCKGFELNQDVEEE